MTFEGEHLRVEDAVLPQIPDPLPEIYFGGSSPAAGRGRGEARRRLPHLGRAAGRGRREGRAGSAGWPPSEGRELRFGIRLHTIARDTAEAAWAEADRLLAEHLRRGDRPGPGRARARASPSARSGCSTSTGAPRTASSHPPEPLGRRRPGPRRRRHRDGRQPRRDRRPDRGVPRRRHRRVRALRLPAPGGGLLVRRGRAARARPPRSLGAPGGRSRRTVPSVPVASKVAAS